MLNVGSLSWIINFKCWNVKLKVECCNLMLAGQVECWGLKLIFGVDWTPYILGRCYRLYHVYNVGIERWFYQKKITRRMLTLDRRNKALEWCRRWKEGLKHLKPCASTKRTTSFPVILKGGGGREGVVTTRLKATGMLVVLLRGRNWSLRVFRTGSQYSYA